MIKHFFVYAVMLFFSNIFFGSDFTEKSENYIDKNIALVKTIFPDKAFPCELNESKGDELIGDESHRFDVLRFYGQRWGFLIKSDKTYVFYHNLLSQKQHLFALVHGMYFASYITQNNTTHLDYMEQLKKVKFYQFWKNCAKTVAATTAVFAGGAYYYGHETAAFGFGLCAGFTGLSAAYLCNAQRKAHSSWNTFCAAGDDQARQRAFQTLASNKILTQLDDKTLNDIQSSLWPHLNKTKKSEE